jgi:hypothetical protein
MTKESRRQDAGAGGDRHQQPGMPRQVAAPVDGALDATAEKIHRRRQIAAAGHHAFAQLLDRALRPHRRHFD